ncbi:hypothetical protein RYX36_007715 [Vicia faba]
MMLQRVVFEVIRFGISLAGLVRAMVYAPCLNYNALWWSRNGPLAHCSSLCFYLATIWTGCGRLAR